MKFKSIIGSLFITSSAYAQQWVSYDYGSVSPNAEIHYTHTYDSDKYKTNTFLIGGYKENGIGAFVGWSDYHSPSFSTSSEFGQVGYKSDNLSGKVGIRNLYGESSIIADIEYRKKVSNTFSYGITSVTDNLDSVNGILNHIKSIYLGADIDYQPTDRTNVALVVSDTYYTDNNYRQMVRAKLSYEVLPEYGVSTYYKTKLQKDTSPGSKNYYSPSELYENSLGVAFRQRVSSVVVTGTFDYGIQDATSADNYKSSQTIHSYQLGVQTPVTKKDGITYGATIIKTNSGNTYSSSNGYSWTGINAWMKISF